MGVPPQRALLRGDAEPVRVGAVGLDGALRHHVRAVRPRGHELLHTMPVDG
uniref:LAC1 n=1 Tax=Arundo donax TaxID=35708 RepID=A0A0A9HR50_ARUDO